MNEADIIQVLRDGLWTSILVAGPALAVALVVSLGIALFQALTQVQEMTLTFVPKVVAIIATVMLALPLMFQLLTGLMERMTDIIVRL
ncbi:flagellar biosynthetic protein FliQ [Inquilinus limosus]|uniref:flagellar biosynthetic protein FliQ n=1 Tax=Inquilinus limosus TaxID=171674 RepID=UPI000424EF9D|nr:flagellar biosynthetic protein FliQ [Inquilinus limosus]